MQDALHIKTLAEIIKFRIIKWKLPLSPYSSCIAQPSIHQSEHCGQHQEADIQDHPNTTIIILQTSRYENTSSRAAITETRVDNEFIA